MSCARGLLGALVAVAAAISAIAACSGGSEGTVIAEGYVIDEIAVAAQHHGGVASIGRVQRDQMSVFVDPDRIDQCAEKSRNRHSFGRPCGLTIQIPALGIDHCPAIQWFVGSLRRRAKRTPMRVECHRYGPWHDINLPYQRAGVGVVKARDGLDVRGIGAKAIDRLGRERDEATRSEATNGLCQGLWGYRHDAR